MFIILPRAKAFRQAVKSAEEDNGLRVRRQYLSRDGKPMSDIRQNDLVVVKITLTSTNGLNVENVVVTDLLRPDWKWKTHA